MRLLLGRNTLTSGLEQTRRVRGDRRPLRLAIPEVPLEALEGEDAADDARVVGEEEGPDTAERDQVDGPEGPQRLGHDERSAVATRVPAMSRYLSTCAIGLSSITSSNSKLPRRSVFLEMQVQVQIGEIQ